MYIVQSSSGVGVLAQDRLTAVCQDTCRQSLDNLRTKILTDCDAARDTIHYSYMTYPATYIADRYLYFYDVSCYRDESSGELCDAVLAGWRNETGGSPPHFCEDCWLGPISVQLSSPIGYNEARAREFASLTSSCSVNGYAWASPTPYGEADSTSALMKLLTTTEATATAGEGFAPLETPMIYPLLELGTAARDENGLGSDDSKPGMLNTSG
ncbi:unnamed protein product [Discula destructiva]